MKEVIGMAKIDLTRYGITGTTKIIYNPSYDELYTEEMKPGLTGYEVGKDTELGAVNVMTGIYTGRSPKDKYIADRLRSALRRKGSGLGACTPKRPSGQTLPCPAATPD